MSYRIPLYLLPFERKLSNLDFSYFKCIFSESVKTNERKLFFFCSSLTSVAIDSCTSLCTIHLRNIRSMWISFIHQNWTRTEWSVFSKQLLVVCFNWPSLSLYSLGAYTFQSATPWLRYRCHNYFISYDIKLFQTPLCLLPSNFLH